jgi:hypothetical protein
MIKLYYWTTPNGHKITLMLEELGLAYTVIPVNIGKGDQFDAEFLRFSPNNKIPAIIDTRLANSTGKARLLDARLYRYIVKLTEVDGSAVLKTMTAQMGLLKSLDDQRNYKNELVKL